MNRSELHPVEVLLLVALLALEAAWLLGWWRWRWLPAADFPGGIEQKLA